MIGWARGTCGSTGESPAVKSDIQVICVLVGGDDGLVSTVGGLGGVVSSFNDLRHDLRYEHRPVPATTAIKKRNQIPARLQYSHSSIPAISINLLI